MPGESRFSAESSFRYDASVCEADKSIVELIRDDIVGLVRENDQFWLLAGSVARPTRIRLFDQGLSEAGIRACLALHTGKLICTRGADARLSCDMLTIALASNLLVDDFRAIEDRVPYLKGALLTAAERLAPHVRDASEIDDQPTGEMFWLHATPISATPSTKGCEILFWIPSGSLWHDIEVKLADGTAFNGLAARAALFVGGSAPLLVRRGEHGLTCKFDDLARRAGHDTKSFDPLGRFPISPRVSDVVPPAEAAVRRAA